MSQWYVNRPASVELPVRLLRSLASLHAYCCFAFQKSSYSFSCFIIHEVCTKISYLAPRQALRGLEQHFSLLVFESDLRLLTPVLLVYEL